MSDDIPVPEDADRESYVRGYQDALGMVREACAMLEVTGVPETETDSADGPATTAETDSGDECPDCGAALVPVLGGRRCRACGYADDDPMESDDEPALSDLIE